MRVVHLYPFSPSTVNGGTLRLKMAMAAFEGESQELWCFDHRTRRWTRGSGTSQNTAVTGSGEASRSVIAALKRRLFPSTLWEAGTDAIRSFHDSPAETSARSADVVVIHTTYIGRLAAVLRGPRRVVDAYDLVWRAHSIDARREPAARLVRSVYAASVRAREEAALAHADCVLVAGWADYEALCLKCESPVWVPTGLDTAPVPKRHSSEALRVGFLGDFAHSPTRESARMLLSAPVSFDGRTEIYLAGPGSTEFAMHPRTHALGRVGSPAELYSLIDCAVIPVACGAGMKVKLVEALLAQRAVVTTPLGVEGFPQWMHGCFSTVADCSLIDSALCRQALADFSTNPLSERVRDTFVVASVSRYRAAAMGLPV